MGTHKIYLNKEVDNKYTSCNLKTMKLLDCVLIHVGVRAVIRLNMVRFSCGAYNIRYLFFSEQKMQENFIFVFLTPHYYFIMNAKQRRPSSDKEYFGI